MSVKEEESSFPVKEVPVEDQSSSVVIPVEDKSAQEKRMPKKRVALLMGYCGFGYLGMQINNDLKTIERDLFKALIKAGAVSQANSDSIHKVQLQRSSRTDKNVHAARQVVTLKAMGYENPTAMVSKINQHLPSAIRVYGLLRVNQSFNPKNACESRVYEYTLPTYCLASENAAQLKESIENSIPNEFIQVPVVDDSNSDEAEDEKTTVEGDAEEIKKMKFVLSRQPIEIGAEEALQFRNHRATDEDIEKLSRILGKYVGTHNYHNFSTSDFNFEDAKSKRHILSFSCGKPFLVKDETGSALEWVSLKVHGQSFMMHQIRKMVGLAIMLMRLGDQVDVDTVFERVFSSATVNIPKAPGIGLFLEDQRFDYHNTRISKLNGGNNKGGEGAEREPVSFDPYLDQVNKLKEEQIYPVIYKLEKQDNAFGSWCRFVDCLLNEYRYLLPEWTAPTPNPVNEGNDENGSSKKRNGNVNYEKLNVKKRKDWNNSADKNDNVEAAEAQAE